jgi:hypothetical protein
MTSKVEWQLMSSITVVTAYKIHYNISFGTMTCSSNPPLPSLVHPTFPPSTTATINDRSPCFSARNVLTSGWAAAGFPHAPRWKKSSIRWVNVGGTGGAGVEPAFGGGVPRGRTMGVGKAGKTGNISSICGNVGNGTDLALSHQNQPLPLPTGERTHSTTPIQKSGGRLCNPSALPRSHFPRVQWMAGFHTWKKGKYGFSTRLANGSVAVSRGVGSSISGGEMREG